MSSRRFHSVFKPFACLTRSCLVIVRVDHGDHHGRDALLSISCHTNCRLKKKLKKNLKSKSQANVDRPHERLGLSSALYMLLNTTAAWSPPDLLSAANGSSVLPGGAVGVAKDSFANALTKNIVAMLVWLTLSVINGSMVHTFLQHRCTHVHTHTHTHTAEQSCLWTLF